ncbi:hypothetical protein ElyMa_002581900 [Elysia marginata]|uniref:PH domain-containing protein n=1 Tax=Elysia marginata TaxID=1093978 RepID=A0AAV4H2I7_9GAST|nr:hypothetical protein ElyMa_002581900 [Elysia marginata]
MADNTYWRASDIYVNPDIEGYLVEKKLVRNAKTWCSLQGTTLYLQRSQGTSIHTINMATEVQSVRKLVDAHTQFEISYKKGKYTFICSSPTECTDWVMALDKAMKLKSNGIGRSVFHDLISDQPEDSADNVYATPSDDAFPQQGQSTTQSDNSVYDDVQSQPAISDTGQKCDQNRTSVRPPLPSMQSRLVKALQQQHQDDYVEGVYTDVATLTSRHQEEDTDGFTPQDSKSSDYQQDSVYTDGVSDLSSNSSTSEPVTLRSRSSVTSSYLASVTQVVENGIEDEEEEVDEAERVDAFAELDQALAPINIPELDLQCPLTEEDYLPDSELRLFLANNKLLHGESQRSVFKTSNHDPVASLKAFLKDINT